MDSSQLAALTGALERRTVAVAGDGVTVGRVPRSGPGVADELGYGRVTRVAREALLLIREYDSTEVVPGAGRGAAARG